jgi:hypothetical protein
VETEADFIACCKYIDILQKNMNTPCITTVKNTAPIITLHLPLPLSHEHKLVTAWESDLLYGTQSANAPRKTKQKNKTKNIPSSPADGLQSEARQSPP